MRNRIEIFIIIYLYTRSWYRWAARMHMHMHRYDILYIFWPSFKIFPDISNYLQLIIMSDQILATHSIYH